MRPTRRDADPNRQAEAVHRLAQLVEQLRDELGGLPTFGEFLEVLGVSMPARAVDSVAVPLRLLATTKGNRRYVGRQPSRVTDLNDAVFVDASDWLSFLVDGISTAVGRPVSSDDLIAAIRQAVKASDISFQDLAVADLSSLRAEAPKRARALSGDVVAIPHKNGGYRLAVIITHNRFGTALGLLRGSVPLPRFRTSNRHEGLRVVYTDDQLIARARWPIIGHEEELLMLFPAEPEIYHAPDLPMPGTPTSEFGLAETPNGDLRPVSKEEAERVGLLSGTYRQVHHSSHLQQSLDEEV